MEASAKSIQIIIDVLQRRLSFDIGLNDKSTGWYSQIVSTIKKWVYYVWCRGGLFLPLYVKDNQFQHNSLYDYMIRCIKIEDTYDSNLGKSTYWCYNLSVSEHCTDFLLCIVNLCLSSCFYVLETCTVNLP
jgi:hypothetical protein